MDVQIICVGKLKEKFYLEACQEYLKRLGPFCKPQLLELPEEKLPQDPTQGQIDAALAKEAAAVRAKLAPGTLLVALCIEGKEYSSQGLAQMMNRWQTSSAKHLVFLMGSSFGLDEGLKQQADVRLSMSPMTFPHHLARVMLLEQIYRAYQIQSGSRYHK